MRISSLKKLHNCGIFRNFSWNELSDFSRYNLIYGQNGSGKTTISRILRCLELHDPPNCKVVISMDKSDDIRGEDFSISHIPIYVFNSDYVRHNVFPIEGKNIPPIIVIGHENKKEQEKLAEMIAELDNTKKVHAYKKAQHNTAKEKFDKHCKSCSLYIKKMLGGFEDGNNVHAQVALKLRCEYM